MTVIEIIKKENIQPQQVIYFTDRNNRIIYGDHLEFIPNCWLNSYITGYRVAYNSYYMTLE